MSNHSFLRIITFMRYPDFISSNPQSILEEGTRIVTLPKRERFFVVRKVVYDDSMTPMYSLPSREETKYSSLEALENNYPYSATIFESPILDNDNSLKTWNNET